VSTENQVIDPAAIRDNKLALVERFADDLAHEIKNPLHSMVINLEVLRRRLSRLDEPGGDLLRYASVLGTELERVNRRIDLLLRVVRPEPDTDERVFLGEILEELEQLVLLACEQRNVVLDSCFPLPDGRARLPRAATRQMLLDLVLSALDSLDDGGTLFIATDRVGELVRVGIDDPYLPVVRMLAHELGGDLEVQGAADTAFGAFSGAPARYLLSLSARA
jgi:signal transduction histidine kinase